MTEEYKILNQIGFAPVGVVLTWAIKLSHVVSVLCLLFERYIKWAVGIIVFIVLTGIAMVHYFCLIFIKPLNQITMKKINLLGVFLSASRVSSHRPQASYNLPNLSNCVCKWKGHNFTFRLRSKLDSFQNLIFRGNGGWNNNGLTSNSNNLSYLTKNQPINQSLRAYLADGRGYNFNCSLTWLR